MAAILGSWVRLSGLDALDTRGDEVELLLRIQDGERPWPYLVEHFRDFGFTRQLPLPRVLTTAWVRWSGTAASPVSVRLPFVLAGALTAVAAAWLGFEFAGKRLAVVLALLAAVNPYSIFWSKTAHIYAFPLLFLTASFAASLRLSRQVAVGRAGPRTCLAASLCAIAAGASHMTAWPAIALCWALPLGIWLRRLGWRNLITAVQARRHWVLLSGPVATMLFLAPWAWKFVDALLRQAFDPVWSEPQTTTLYSLASMWRLPFTYSFGSGWRGLLSVGLPVAAVLLSLKSPGRRLRVLGVASALLLLFLLITAASSSGFFALRYYSALWPLWLTLTGYGLLAVTERLAAWSIKPVVSWGGAALLLALALGPPVHALMELRGNPVEFRRIAAALDEVLPEGAPAVVNGMNVVRIEMRNYMPERAVPTYTVPDVGLAMWRGNDWRGSTEKFLERFSDAALVQQGRNYYDHPEIGPWQWPEDWFANAIELVNEPALLLRELNLGASEDFYTNRCTTEIRYNQPEDLVERARRSGESAVLLWGEGWKYGKSLNLMDWRLLDDRATLRIHNLTDQYRRVLMRVDATTSGGVKRVSLAGRAAHDFEAGDPQSWQLALVLQPGLNEFDLVDELWSIGQVQLLVSQIVIDAGS